MNKMICIIHILFTFYYVIVLQLRQKITSATSAIKSVFGQEQAPKLDAVSLTDLDLITSI